MNDPAKASSFFHCILYVPYFVVSQDGMPLEVPDTFWNGTSKLMWQAQHKDEIFSSFPTFHIGFSSNEDSSEGFSLAVTPQVLRTQCILQ